MGRGQSLPACRSMGVAPDGTVTIKHVICPTSGVYPRPACSKALVVTFIYNTSWGLCCDPLNSKKSQILFMVY